MKAVITLYLDNSAELSEQEFKDVVDVVKSVAELSSVIENVDVVIEEQ